jgi:hypothetical protein
MQDFGSGDTSSNLVGGISKSNTGIVTLFGQIDYQNDFFLR